ncbi:MAG: IS110 family transposase, partial [Microthrixaceae bacterium]|nr:IS110 family transposase [Microthrixaceae bacterium]
MTDQTSLKFGGVDWATDEHVVCVVDDDGRVCDEFEVEHAEAGLRQLCRRLLDNGVERVAIERPDGPVVAAMMEAGLEVVVVVSRSVKAFRQRYSTSGSKSDRRDAFVLADCLRSDGHRWPSLQPDTPATVTLRSHVRARQDLVGTRVAVTNQLRAHLQINFPGAVGLFAELDGLVSRRFLRRFTSENDAAWLTEKRLGNWLRSAGYNNKRPAAALFEHLQRAPKGPTGAEATARAKVAIAYVEVIDTLIEQIRHLETLMSELLETHPDAHIFRSLPRCGTIRAATMLAEIGDCRAKFPDATSLVCLAGVAPSTRASGRHRSVTFRYSANSRLRNVMCSFAGDSRNANQWAAHRYQQLREDGKRHPHAERILARTWTQIIWRCWQDNVPYDP